MNTAKVGILGTGAMGRAALAKVSPTYDTVLYDAFKELRDSLSAEGYDVAASPRELAKRADVILLFLPGPKEVAEAVEGEDGVLQEVTSETVIVDLSTVDPETSRRLSSMVEDRGGAYLDAPILGRPDRAGGWTLPVGGDEAALERVAPVLNCFASRLIPVGASGAGNVVKLLNNLMFGTINNITAEVLSAAPRLGVPSKVVFEAIAESGAATVSNLFRSIGPKIVDGDFSPVFRLELMYKDMDLGTRMAESAGATLLVAETAKKMTEIALAQGLQGQDSSIVTKVSEAISKPTENEKGDN